MADFTPKAYVKTNCPFSFKFRLFALEAGLANRMEFVELDVDAVSHTSDKSDLRALVGRAHTFPIVEVAQGEFMDDSDLLIDHFAKLHDIDDNQLATLNFYRDGLFPTFLEMFHILAMPLGWMARLGRKPKAFR
ncbi:MAG: hypothetical protein P8L68_09140 [Paracoccaceae bacterium]|nr:hypothetical protein [Paracoccaceae bacterium]MDG2258642.1 hypothetical protein [Paracoccaceae bacterium]